MLIIPTCFIGVTSSYLDAATDYTVRENRVRSEISYRFKFGFRKHAEMVREIL